MKLCDVRCIAKDNPSSNTPPTCAKSMHAASDCLAKINSGRMAQRPMLLEIEKDDVCSVERQHLH